MKINEPSFRQDRPTRRLRPIRAAWRPWVWLALVALVAWRCGGGGSGGSCSSPDLQGLWTGPVTSDEASRGNPGTITANIFEDNCSFAPTELSNTGTWKFDFEDPSLDQLFAIENGSATQSEVNLSVAGCNGPASSCGTVTTCIYDIAATLVTPFRMNGSYTASPTCASFNQGTFDITLQNRFTPTPAATVIVAPTPTPTP